QRLRTRAGHADAVVTGGGRGRAATDRDDVGLVRAQTGNRAARAVIRDSATFVDCADGDRARRAARRSDGACRRARVAGGDADEDAAPVNASTSRDSGSRGSPGPPSERLMTSTFWRLSHESAASTVSSVPPWSESAFAITSDARGATPR